MQRKWITKYKKNQKGAYSLLIGLTVVIVLFHLSLGKSHIQFQPINRADLCKIIAMNHNNPKLVQAIISVESEWNPKAISKKGAVGLMQVLPASGHHFLGYSKSELLCPEKNIIAGTTILKYYQRTSPNLKEALHKYSGGAEGYYEKVMRRM